MSFFPQHRISNSDNIRSGNALPANRTVTGVPMENVVYDDLGLPVIAVADAFIKAATGAELPNNATKTYTFPASAVSPTDGTYNSGVADVGRNVVVNVTHATSIVALTVTVTGTDVWGKTMSELFTITATGTTKTVNGKKAFKTITSIAITSAGDSTTDTANVGFGDVLGASYRVRPGAFIQGTFNGTKEATQGTFVEADATTPATTSTGDVRGTYDPNGTLDGAKRVVLIYVAKNGPTDEDGFGVAQV